MNNRLTAIENDIKKFVGLNLNVSADELMKKDPTIYEDYRNLIEKLAKATDAYGHSKELDSLKNLLYGTLKI